MLYEGIMVAGAPVFLLSKVLCKKDIYLFISICLDRMQWMGGKCLYIVKKYVPELTVC